MSLISDPVGNRNGEENQQELNQIQEIIDLKNKLKDAEGLIKRHELIWTHAPDNPRKTFTSEEINKIFDIIETSPFYNMGKGFNSGGSYYVEWLRRRDKCLTAFLYLLACRPREACSLRFDDLDLANGLVTIRPENNKERAGRIIPLPKALLTYLKDYLSLPQYIWGSTEYIFPSFENRLKPLASNTWKSRFRRILKAAGIWIAPIGNSKKSSYSSYTLRHTRATELLVKTGDIHMVSNILGHKAVRSTQSYLADYKVSKTYFEKMREAMQGTQNPKEEFLES